MIAGIRFETSIQNIQHSSFISSREVFYHDDIFVAFDHMPLSLAEVAGNPPIKEPEVASIVGQARLLNYLVKLG